MVVVVLLLLPKKETESGHLPGDLVFFLALSVPAFCCLLAQNNTQPDGWHSWLFLLCCDAILLGVTISQFQTSKLLSGPQSLLNPSLSCSICTLLLPRGCRSLCQDLTHFKYFHSFLLLTQASKQKPHRSTRLCSIRIGSRFRLAHSVNNPNQSLSPVWLDMARDTPKNAQDFVFCSYLDLECWAA